MFVFIHLITILSSQGDVIEVFSMKNLRIQAKRKQNQEWELDQ